MPHVDIPWIGLAAVVAMFALPFAPSWLFEGPRVISTDRDTTSAPTVEHLGTRIMSVASTVPRPRSGSADTWCG